MRVLLLLPAARPADQGALPPLADALLATLRGVGVGVSSTRDIAPDLDACEIVHLLAAPPIDRVARQFAHARRWGKPVVVSLLPSSRPAQEGDTDDPIRRYKLALWRLVRDGSDAVVALARMDDAPSAEERVQRSAVRAVLGDPVAGTTLRETYDAIVQEWATMTAEGVDAGTTRWLPSMGAEEYGKHLEDLVQLQLEVIAYRDAEYEALRRQLDDARNYAGTEGSAGHRALKTEYERLGEWSRELAARHEALQADYARLQEWAGDLEGQLRAARGGGLRARVGRLLRRG